MLLPDHLGHLMYSTLVHPGDDWSQMWESLRTHVPAGKARVSPDAPFGVSHLKPGDADDHVVRELERVLGHLARATS